MKVSALISALMDQKIRISLEGTDLAISAPENVLTDAWVKLLVENKAPLINYLQNLSDNTFNSIDRVPAGQDYALSHSQRRMWIIGQLERGMGKTAYNISGCYAFEGHLDLNSLERALQAVMMRHESLRTVFITVNGEPRQRILSAEEFGDALNYEDLSGMDGSGDEVSSRVQSAAESGFDLSTGPLVRAYLLKVSAERYVFLLTLHHIISDGWSMAVLVRELLQLYNSYSSGIEDPLPPLRIHYRDYASWQNGLLSEGGLESSRRYWHDQLGGELPVLELPSDYRRPDIKQNNGSQQSLLLPAAVNQALNEKSRSAGATLFMMLLSTVKVLLYRYTGQQDLIVGTAVAGRNHVDLEDQIGFYVNTLALRTQLEGDWDFDHLLSAVKEVTLGAFEHQQYPFDLLVDELSPDRNLGRMPVFDVLVVLQNVDIGGTGEPARGLDPVQVSEYETPGTVAKFDLTFNFQESPSGLLLEVEYSTDLFSSDRISRMLSHYGQLVREVLRDSSQAIGRLDYLSASEREELLSSFSHGAVTEYGDEDT
ncbi:condensation domain-containing protein, partial [Mucilaginibacter sp. RCC_168]|uniref:condensation domain-containing protein n=1 Tax=Mucilaginibacter sp. RCC_168 TaxID=3239221 RepID=UPI0035237B1F